MENNNNNNYVTRDFYDANMAEFRNTVREMIAASEARCEKMLVEIKIEREKIDNTQISVLLGGVSFFFVGASLFLMIWGFLSK